jgi:hypothetical protein
METITVYYDTVIVGGVDTGYYHEFCTSAVTTSFQSGPVQIGTLADRDRGDQDWPPKRDQLFALATAAVCA